MLFHLPKPLHGWREFAGEVGIIVIGVLIALGFQQLMEAWNWHDEAKKAVETLKKESSANFNYSAERVAAQPCLDAQLDRLMAVVMNSAERLRPVAKIPSTIGDLAFRQPTGRPYANDVWNSVVSDGVASHLNSEGRAMMSKYYSQLVDMRALSEKGDETVAKLSVMLWPIALDPATKGNLAVSIAEQKTRGALMSTDAIQELSYLTSLGQAPPGQKVDERLELSGTIKYCRGQGFPVANWRAELAKQQKDDPVPLVILAD